MQRSTTEPQEHIVSQSELAHISYTESDLDKFRVKKKHLVSIPQVYISHHEMITG